MAFTSMLNGIDVRLQDLKVPEQQSAGETKSVAASVAHAAPRLHWFGRAVVVHAIEEPVLPVVLGALPLGLGAMFGSPSGILLMAGGLAVAPAACAGVAVGVVAGVGGQALIAKRLEYCELLQMQNECAVFKERINTCTDRGSLRHLSEEWINTPGAASKFATVRNLHNDVSNELVKKFYAMTQAAHAVTDEALQSLFDKIVEGDPQSAELAARSCAEKVTSDENEIETFVAAVVTAVRYAEEGGL